MNCPNPILDGEFEDVEPHDKGLRSGIAPAKKPSLDDFLATAPLLLDECQDLICRLDDLATQLDETLPNRLRALRRMAQDAQLTRFARVVQGLSIYATLVHSGALEVKATDWRFLAETTRALELMLEKLRRFRDEGACEEETADAKSSLISAHPLIAGIVAARPA